MSRAGASLFIFLLFAFGGGPCFSQVTARYSGEASFGGEPFDAEFEFYESGGDTVYHGRFFLNRPLTDHHIDEPFNFLTVEGAFHRGSPDKLWKLSTGEFSVNGIATYRDYAYIKEVEGIELHTTAHFDRGIRTGTWKIFEWEVEASQVIDTLLNAEIGFENDLLFGPLKFENHGYLLTGSIGADELVTGTWEFFKKEEEEAEKRLAQQWKFLDGRLSEKIIKKGDAEINYRIFQDTLTKGESEYIEISPKFFEIVRLTALINNEAFFDQVHFEHGFEEFYSETVDLIVSSDSLLFIAAGKEVAFPAKTEVYKFPLSGQERRHLERTKEAAASVGELIDLLNKDPQISLARISTPEVSWYMGVVHLIDEHYLGPVRTALKLYDEGIFEYIDRDAYINTRIHFAPEIRDETAVEDSIVHVEYKFQSYQDEQEEVPLKRLRNLAEGLIGEIELINDSLELFIFEIRKEEELTDKEAELFERFEELMALSDSVLTEQSDELAGFDLSEAVNDFLKSKVSAYASISSSSERMRAVDDILVCMEGVENLISVLESSLQNYYATRDAYKRQVFNSFTYTYMEETIKPTIYRSFENVLLPAVYGKTKNLTCDNITSVKRNFEVLFQGMDEILNRDTKKEQRQVKRKSDPKEVSKILNLDLTFND